MKHDIQLNFRSDKQTLTHVHAIFQQKNLLFQMWQCEHQVAEIGEVLSCENEYSKLKLTIPPHFTINRPGMDLAGTARTPYLKPQWAHSKWSVWVLKNVENG